MPVSQLPNIAPRPDLDYATSLDLAECSMIGSCHMPFKYTQLKLVGRIQSSAVWQDLTGGHLFAFSRILFGWIRPNAVWPDLAEYRLTGFSRTMFGRIQPMVVRPD